MSAENRTTPDWALRERESDLAWIAENLPIFEFASRMAYEVSGRGALMVDVTSQPQPGRGNPFGYVLLEQLATFADEDTIRMVQTYKPEQEFVLLLLKETGRSSTYRIWPQAPQTELPAS